jgi:GTP-binding protein
MNEPSSTTLPESSGEPGADDSGNATVAALPTVAVVGRPNVGKSTFFNRIVGGRRAIVDSQPGVTRDVHFAEAQWNGVRFYVVDTGGIVEEAVDAMDEAVRRQALAAVEAADLLLFMVDGREGVHPLDQHIAELLRRQQAQVLLVVNKVDNLPEATEHLEFFELGLGDPIPLSAGSGKGSGDLLDRIVLLLPAQAPSPETASGLRLAVIGRPNVGKSSFINKILGTDRLVVTEEAGTTRDAIDTPFERDGRKFVFVDTAGLRRKSRVTTGLEYYAMLRTLRAIDRADVCVLVADSDAGVGNQDFRIARLAWERGCGLVLAVNKWDLIEKDTNTAIRFERALRKRMPFLSAVPIIFISALSGQRVQRALDLAWQVGEERARNVPTSELNKQLAALTEAVQPPQKRGRPLKFYYATQIGTRPPSFALFTNFPKDVPENYIRYLTRGFREAWGFSGPPIRRKLRARRKERG